MILIKDGRVIDPQTGLDETLDLVTRMELSKKSVSFRKATVTKK